MRELFYLSVSLVIGWLGNLWLERKIRNNEESRRAEAARRERLLLEAEGRLARCVEAYEMLEATSQASEKTAECLRERHKKLLIFLRSVLTHWDKLSDTEQKEALAELAAYRASMKDLN